MYYYHFTQVIKFFYVLLKVLTLYKVKVWECWSTNVSHLIYRWVENKICILIS